MYYLGRESLHKREVVRSFANRDNVCYPRWVFDLMNKSYFNQLVDFHLDLRDKLRSKTSLCLFNRPIPWFNCKMMDCYFWIKSRHLLVRPSKDIPILGEQTHVFILFLIREKCTNQSRVWFLYCTKFTSFNSSTVDWPPSSKLCGAFSASSS